MPKCNKVKNPCKICLGPVTQKNGLQCQGACQSWVHYNCLNYTPGKVKDIKAGIITITCPCPDCETTLPKEYRNDEPFSCSNSECPANHPPKCVNRGCPINKGINVDTTITGCALNKCGKGCKTNSHPQLIDSPAPNPIKPCAPANYPKPIYLEASSDDDDDMNINACSSGCESRDIPGDHGRQENLNLPSFGTIEQMCNTVGLLSDQINNLMAKMQNIREQSDAHKNCPQKGPKPCYCPGNPGRRK